ncbi:uncharacterized protein LOC111347879 [Spodoptera litura]|uniref:Uncharacterized protein LOC111347879 n=1 Tax=Spodoptera litura TaxID=69820 RepID=A0A9J7IH16_SPOLT|nr:uncharacterized protein LOC111347879 [Spodoptera litura]
MSLQSHVRVQDDIYVRLSRAKSNFKKSPKDRITVQYLQTRLESIEELWAEFTLTHTQMVKDFDHKELTSSPYTVNEVYFNTEELYLDLRCELKTALSKFKNSDVPSAMSSNNDSPGKGITIKLPRITIPTFSGKYTEWPTFRDLFVSAIHKNSTIDNVQKLHYLKGYLTGEAEQLLRHIPISESNYERCWTQLETRYNNRKYLSNCILGRLLSQKNIMQESANALKELMDTTSDCLNALMNLDIDVTSWDIIIIHIVALKLDPNSRKDWELKVTSNIDSDELPTFGQLKEFLTSRYRALEFLGTKSSNNSVAKERVFHTAANTAKVCPVCNSNEHKIRNCKQFVNKDVDIRRKFVQDHNLCFNCLGYNHSARLCKCTASCQICKRRHHSLLHPKNEQESAGDKGDPSTQAHSTTVGVESQNKVVACFSKSGVSSQVLLATALVRAVSKNGLFTIRALLDQGSQASFVTERTVQSLGLRKKAVKGSITGIDVNNKLVLNSVVEVKIQSRIDPSYELVVKAYVLKSLTSLLPGRETSYLDWAQVSDIELADPRYHKPDKVDMLLGAEIYSQILQNGFKKAPDGSTVAQATSLGWILSGTVTSASQNTSNITVMHTQLGDDEILKRFWELEREPNHIKKHLLTEEESRCEEIFKATTTREKDGRYVVNLPFKSEDPSCQYGDTRKAAIRRFYTLETKFTKDTQLKEKYADVMKEYLQLGHMRELTKSEEQNEHAVYLPHHAVVRNDKDTTKVRVVFDAFCKGNNGLSLNDDLMIGPRLQPDLRHLLIGWRTHRICLVSDIVKMYRMVRVADHHTDFQRIVWRDNKHSTLKHYKLLTVTFGTSSAPFLAVRSMQQVAYDEGIKYPFAAERVLKDYYMDDLMTGCDTIEEGMQIYNQMNELLAKAGFTLQKWSSNNSELLEKMIGKRYSFKGQQNLKKEKPKRKKFKSLNLYLDSVNILRVGGRLERSDLARDRKNPILIPSNSHFTNLLIADAHDRNLHGGPQLMLNYLSTKYYIQGAKRLVTAYVKCVTCLRYTASTKPQLMGQLPPARVTPNRPFKSSGVDFAGPINLRTSKGRGHHAYKGYICLFVCMTTKAVHIEAVSDLTTNWFLAAFRRFVARRGHCTDMWSDNGTNFHGACRELDTLLRSENSKLAKDIAASLAGEGTTWHFIPPHAPNFGGLWESGIKSCKKHLNRVIGSSTLTFEEMATLLSQVTDSNKFDALTPGHFLVGEPIISAPDRNYEDANISSLKRWHLVQQMTQHFWRRWSSEYLTILFHRYKWSTQNPEPNIGDVVLIKEDNLPPCRWLLGRVVEKHPGLDNLTRVVTIRSNGSMLKRPTSKLCVLPVA